jgi:hypothetical protein
MNTTFKESVGGSYCYACCRSCDATEQFLCHLRHLREDFPDREFEFDVLARPKTGKPARPGVIFVVQPLEDEL